MNAPAALALYCGALFAVGFLVGCAEPGHHRVPPAKYRKSCVIGNVTIHVEEPAGAAAKCADGDTWDDGTPRTPGEPVAGCLHPTADGNTGEFVGAEMVVQVDKRVLWDEFEHLIWNACREAEVR